MIKFVVFSMTRTGSSMLTERLSTHPEVACFGAIFSATGWYNVDKPNEGGVLGRLRERMNPRWIDTTLRIEDRDQLMAELFNVNNDMMAVGFKHHLSGDRKVTESLLGSDMRKIFLSRTNHLATYSSEKVVRVTGQGAARRNVRVIAAKCVFEPKGFDAFRQRRDQINRRAREAMKGTILDAAYHAVPTDVGEGVTSPPPLVVSLGKDGLIDIDELRAELTRTSAAWVLLHDAGAAYNRSIVNGISGNVVSGDIAGIAPFMMTRDRTREMLPAVVSTGESFLEDGYIAPAALLLRREALDHALDRLDRLGLIQRSFLQEIALLATEYGMIVPSPDFIVQSAERPGGPVGNEFARNRLLLHLTRRYAPEVANRIRLYAELSAQSDQLRRLKPLLNHVRNDIAFLRGLWADREQ